MRIAAALLAALLAACAAEPVAVEKPVEDGVPIYRALIGRFPKLPKCIEAAFDDEETDPAELHAALASFAPLLDELVRATRAARCAWTYEGRPCITGEYPIDYALTAARVLTVRARVRLRSNAAAAAIDDLAALAKFGSDLCQDRWIIAHLVGCICQYWACDAVRVWIRSGPTDAALLAKLEERLKTVLGRFPTFLERIRLEKEMSLPLLEEIRDLGFDETIRRVAKDKSEKKESHPMVLLWEEWLRMTLPKDMDRVRDFVSKRWDAALKPFEDEVRLPLQSRRVAAMMDELKAKNAELSQRFARNTLGGKAGEDQAMADLADLLFILWLPAMDKAGQNHERIRLGLETTLLACRLELRFLKTGRYPDALAEIGEAPRDPYDGGRLRYRRITTPKGEGYVMASVGPQHDADLRMRVLTEDCGFDAVLFEKRGYEFSDLTTFGAFRSR